MAGSYSDAPGRRMAWDADGSVMFSIRNTGVYTEPAGSVRTELNDEDNTDAEVAGSYNSAYDLYVLFPELRDLDGIFVATGGASGNDIQEIATSGDTTNGVDGTWTQQIANLTNYTNVANNYRDNFTSLSVSNVRGVRIEQAGTSGANDQLKAVHLYGTISSGATPDRLLFIDNDTGLEFTGPKDFGDIPRGSARDFDIKIKNNSGSLTASTITIDSEDLYLGSGSWYTFDTGSGFGGSASIASLAAGVSSSVVTVRQIIPDSATIGVHAGRLYVSAGSWA